MNNKCFRLLLKINEIALHLLFNPELPQIAQFVKLLYDVSCLIFQSLPDNS